MMSNRGAAVVTGARVLAGLAMWAALACGASSCAQPHALQWLLEYAEEDPLIAAHLLEIRPGGCGESAAGPLYRSEIRRFDDTPMDVPPLSAGTFGFFAEARDAECNVVASGCTEVTLPRAESTVITTLRTESGSDSRCPAARCDRGVCASDPDAGSADAMLDAATPDAFVVPDANAPDAWAPDAYVVPDACDSTRIEGCNGVDDNCNGVADETFDVTTDATNCGTCGNVCPEGANATPACRDRTCGLECRPLYADCDSGLDGCETSLMDVANCGSCGNACSGATPVCGMVGGSPACATGCSGAEVRCGGTCTSTDTDVMNCGTCMNRCSLPRATAACAAGSCRIASCDPGYADCNGNPADGCEVNTLTDPMRCGSCTNACNLANAVEGCSAGSCTVASCDPGFGDCDRAAANGCEINLQTDVTRCGTCSNTCNLTRATEACVAGACAVASCDAGYGNCDGVASNGCEVNLQTDVTHCGMCPTACPACHSCSSGTCTPQSDLTSCSGGRCVGAACCSGCTASVVGVQMCYPGNVDTACGRAGASCTACGRCATCVGGVCTPVANGTACSGAGTAGLCYGGSCCSGCWDGTTCRAGTTDAQCGISGAACVDCPCFCGTTQVCDVGTFRLVDAGYDHSCVVYDDGPSDYVYCWGDNTDGQLGIASIGGTSTPRPVMAGTFTLGATGTLSLGEFHTVATGIMTDTHAWGQNTRGQLGLGSAGAPVASPTMISASTNNVRAGGQHSCWTSGSTFQCWGRNDQGQLGLGSAGADVPTPTTVSGLGTGATGFSLGDAHTCYINTLRQLFCWGANGSGRLGIGSAMTPITSPTRESTSATNWAQVDAGGAHTCARTTVGTLFCWGSNASGRLGIGGGADSPDPVQVGTDTTWVTVSAGLTHTCGIRGGQLFCWGDNSSGQLGDGTTMPRNAPVRVGTDSDWTEVSAGGAHTCGVRSAGVYCWGSNAAGQLGTPVSADATTPQRVCGFL